MSGAGVNEDDATFLVIDEIPDSSSSGDLQLPPRQGFALEGARGQIFTLEWVLSVVPPTRCSMRFGGSDRISTVCDSTELHSWDIDPKSPDEFVRDQISLDRSVIYAAVQQIADSWRNPPGSVDDVLDRLERSGLAELPAGG